MKKLSADNYAKDKFYSSLPKAVCEVLQRQGYVAPVAVLLQLQRISKQQHDDWRMGRIPYLRERQIVSYQYQPEAQASVCQD